MNLTHTGLKPEWLQNMSESSDHRPIIRLDSPADEIDFVTLHNILYFIYIGCANLPVPRQNLGIGTIPQGFPTEADAFLLLRSANKFLLPELKKHCVECLKHGITTENVAERLFNRDCETYPELRKVYFDYLVEHFKEVRETEGWKKAASNDGEITQATARLLFDIFQRLTL